MALRHVKGTLFVDYVRMLRLRKDVDWSQRLLPEDLGFLVTRIDPNGWYPMDTFERMGLAILNVIADGQLETVHEFGKAQADWQVSQVPGLLAPQDPRESLMRFQVMRSSFFDYGALEVQGISDCEAQLGVNYQMGDIAEEAACLQTMGFMERLLELAGAKEVVAHFAQERWKGALGTVIDLQWK